MDALPIFISTLSLYDALPILHLSTPLIRLFLLVLILLLMPTLNFLPVWFALSLLRFRLRLKANQTRSEERFSRNAETDLVCRLLLVIKKTHLIRNKRVVARPQDLAALDLWCYLQM